MIKNREKLYVITRRDLPAGYQAVQAMHAAVDFVMKYHGTGIEWWTVSNYLGFLSVRNEADLKRLASQAVKRGCQVTVFAEPDIGYEITAIAMAPGKVARSLTKRLPLALKEYSVRQRKRALKTYPLPDLW